ncbi:acetyltransferase [Vibrio parahaemolyticus]|nr:acetyltransferase [Vibrio parahaemolyticus]EGR1728335.1 acetyltransferase [Vibrio parahaemolyticus]
MGIHITKRLRQIRNARHFRFESALVFTAQWFRLDGLRCSLLNAALCN